MKEKRQILLKALNAYLDGAVFANSEHLRLSTGLRTTYNGIVGELGANEIWDEALRFPSRQTFVDPVTGNVVFFGTATNDALLRYPTYPYPKPAKMMKAAGAGEHNLSSAKWWYYLLRLKCDDSGLIEEVEELTIPNNLINFDIHPKDYFMRDLRFDNPAAPGDILSRKELVDIADTYFDGVAKLIGYDDVLVHPDAQRIEFGVQRTNSKRDYHSISASFNNPKFYWHIKNRRYPVVIPEMGVVVGFAEFVQSAEDTSPGFLAVEAFKIVDGLFRDILVYFFPESR